MIGKHYPRNLIITEYSGSAKRVVRRDPGKSTYTLATYFWL
jgi:hypothetical protein